ncbi:hypothetical protein DE146DRAFT_476415 [Phaeosphaeria sp. MPI-PUGE-AT-0046c]|nr:hypothetical protein DE146DRAFT_476415 [Phaeosphaeria sp. MPI-PUGE-AT-0046c]
MSSPAASPATAANISIRKYIYFLPYPLPAGTPVPYSIHLPASNPLNLPTTLFEPTSTLVLTAPSGTFVDLRFLKPTSPSTSEEVALEWGFAGHSSSAPISGKESAGVKHSTWTHFVDSRVPVGQTIPVDEGDMYPISDTRTLEHGHAFHPHLKAVKSHEEMWEDEHVTSTSTTAPQEGKKRCVVLRCQNDARGVRGVVVRLGKYVQGVLVVGNEVTAERWEWSAEGGWKRTKRVGKGMVPCAVLVQEELMKEGVKVQFGEFEWVVESVWEW